MSTTPIIRISQLTEETETTISGNPSNTWFAIVNSDIMKTRRISLDTLMKYFFTYFDEPAILPYLSFQTYGGLKANNASLYTANLGETVILSDVITFSHANSSFTHANAGILRANACFLKTNLSFAHANSAFAHANSAFETANGTIILNFGGGISSVSSNPDSTKLKLGQTLTVTGSPLSVTTTNGLVVDGGTSKQVYLGQNINLGANPITINTINGISGGRQTRLGETITIDGSITYNHALSAYNYANSCMIKPPITYVTSAQDGLVTVANNRYIIIGDINSEIHVKMPSGTPKVNTFVYFTNMSQSRKNVIEYNGTVIHGLPPNEHLKLDVPNISITLCYIDSTRGWVIV